jgi:hypothetical protein
MNRNPRATGVGEGHQEHGGLQPTDDLLIWS